MRNRILFIIALLFSINVYANHQTSLTLGFMPYLSSTMILKKYTPLAEYLSDRLGIKVEIVIAKDYAQHIENTGLNKLDISFLGGSPYVVINKKYGKKPLLVRYEFNNKPSFRSVIFVHDDSSLKSLSELKGKKFAFGSSKSTLSTQVPLYLLTQAGVDLSSLGSYRHLRNHENVVYGVKYKQFDAGSVAEEVFLEKREEGIKVLAYSPEISTHVFVTRSNMSLALQKKIRNALLELKTLPDKKSVLTSISANLSGFVPVSEQDYDYHRNMLKVVLPMLD